MGYTYLLIFQPIDFYLYTFLSVAENNCTIEVATIADGSFLSVLIHGRVCEATSGLTSRFRCAGPTN